MKKLYEIIKPHQFLLLLLDIVVVNGSYFLACFLHREFSFHISIFVFLARRIIFVTAIYIALFMLRRLYSNLWKYMGFYELVNAVISAGFGTALCWIADYTGMKICVASGISRLFNVMPFVIYVDAFLYICCFSVGFRALYRAYRMLKADSRRRRKDSNKRIMIIGAGDMGNSVLFEMGISGFKSGTPVVIVDDDIAKKNMRIRGIPVAGKIDDIPSLVQKYDVNEIIYCIPTASPERRKEIFEIAMSTGCTLKRAPNIDELGAEGKVDVDKIKRVDVLDLLSRPEIKLDPDVCKYVTGETVLVTGGGGSIGSELCRQIARYNPEKIVIFDIYENNAYFIALKESDSFWRWWSWWCACSYVSSLRNTEYWYCR